MDNLGTENKELYIQQYNFTKDVQTVLSNVYAENKRKSEVKAVEEPKKVLETDNKIVVSFKGTIEQANKLKEYAKELGMEEIL